MNLNSMKFFLAGGCLWGVQEFLRHLPGIHRTEAGRANGISNSINTKYDGYAECVKVVFDSEKLSINRLLGYFFEIIDPFSWNKQGEDIGEKYRTGIYSENPEHLYSAQKFISKLNDADSVVVEVRPLINYLRSSDEHQDRLQKYPDENCHIPLTLLHKYKIKKSKLEIGTQRT